MIEFQIRKILYDIKSKNPKKRFQALIKLHNLKLKITEGKEVSINVLNDMIRTAAYPFGEPYDDWDQPSYYLLDYVTTFKHRGLTKSMIKNYPNFSQSGKSVVLNFLCEFEEDKFLNAIIKIYEKELKTNQAVIPVSGLYERPLWLTTIISKFYNELVTDTYRDRFYQMLLYCNRMDLLLDSKKEIIREKLIEDYKQARENIQAYLNSYSTKDVYMFWKNNYLELRDKLGLYLSLMEYYSDENTENYIKEALTFKDPTLQVKAIRVALIQNVHVDENIMMYCAKHIETSEMLYSELLEIKRDSLFPITEKKQHFFAKSHLFHHLLYEIAFDDFPTEFRIEDKVETKNYYGQPIRFYLLSFSVNNEQFVGWVGAYSLEVGDDLQYMWEGTYTNFEKMDEHSIDEHINLFMKKREKRNETYNKEVHFEIKSPFSAYYQGICVLVVLQWIVVLVNQEDWIGAVPLSLLILLMTILKLVQRKQNWVKIEGHKLTYKTRTKTYEIFLHDIKNIKLTMGKVKVFTRENELAFVIKKKHIRVKYLIDLIQGLTSHLKEPPTIK
jgi:hypothetical protein